jgi:hypothetical protein
MVQAQVGGIGGPTGPIGPEPMPPVQEHARSVSESETKAIGSNMIHLLIYFLNLLYETYRGRGQIQKGPEPRVTVQVQGLIGPDPVPPTEQPQRTNLESFSGVNAIGLSMIHLLRYFCLYYTKGKENIQIFFFAF